MRSFRDPDSFRLVPPPSSGSSELSLSLLSSTCDSSGEREGVEGHVESQGPYLQVADIPSALFPLARAFHWPTQQDWEMCSSHMLRRKCMVATPCRPSVPLLSSPGLFWDQDLSSPLDQRATLGGPSPL